MDEPVPPATPGSPEAGERPAEEPAPAKRLAKATFAGGCFWCVEAVFERLAGVEDVRAGYIGGRTEAPTYDAVCSGRTGHAEAVEVHFDPEQVAYEELVEVFFATHDPTTKDRQGGDVGSQYRSAIFTHDDAQREAARAVIARIDKEGTFGRPIVTEVVPAPKFHLAEDYHQDYFAKNPNQPYCAATIPPKLAKLEKAFKDHLKTPRPK